MRRTRVAFYVTYLIIPQLSDPSTGVLRVFQGLSSHTACLVFWIGESAFETPQKFFSRLIYAAGAERFIHPWIPGKRGGTARSVKSFSLPTASV